MDGGEVAVDRGTAVLLTAVAGGLVALQAPINSMLGRSVGTFQAAFMSFAIGTVVLALIAGLAKGGFGDVGEARHLPWYYLTGGMLGAAYVTTVLVTVRALGAGGVVAATISGQLTLGVLIDQLGILGVTRQPITVARIAGVALLAAGTYLVVRG
jgi:transporter family-2 protein